ncbi:MAG: DUF3341 domain-containing protein [Alphaproteobacteria bacterium]|nr:DUF3341 domain-containing protein [Alphaproteobacteria bacterium]
MAIKKFVVGCFTDEKELFPAVKTIRKSGFKIHDVYTPYPVHGLDTALGLRETSLHTAGFIYALIGLCTAFGGIGWILTIDWPQNYGGKPHFALPAWIPIMFECTVLFSAVGMVLTFCYICQIGPLVKKHRFHLRATDDYFVMVIECTQQTNTHDLEGLLKSLGACETKTETVESGWWLGRYDLPAPSVASAVIALILITSLSACSNGDAGREQNRVYMPDMAYSRAVETYDDKEHITNKGIFYNAEPAKGSIARGSDIPFLIAKDTPGSTLNYLAAQKIINPITSLSSDDQEEAHRLYLVYCGICHGQKYDGNGPLYKDGSGPFPAKPATLVGDPKYDAMPEGQMFYSVTYGKNLMGSYASQLTTKQRWMVIKYIKMQQEAVSKPQTNTNSK